MRYYPRALPKKLFTAVALLTSLFMIPASAIDKGKAMTSNTQTSNKTLVKTAFEAWAAGTGSPFNLLADSAEWTIVGKSAVAKTYPNKAAFIHDVIQPFNARMSKPLKPSIRQLYADGDTVIVFFDAEATATDGKPYKNTYAWFMEMKEGKAVRVFAFFDSIEFDDLWSRVKPQPSK
jgi:ketosteroid isomerase-like protein